MASQAAHQIASARSKKVDKSWLGSQRASTVKKLTGHAKVAEIVRQVADGTYVSVDFEGDPWDRQVWEKDNAWAAFVIYRDMGPLERSVSKVAKQIGKHVNNVFPWSKNNRWVERAALYDRDVDIRLRTAKVKALEEMQERQIKIGMVFQQVSARELTKINLRSANAPQTEVLTPEQILRYAQEGMRMERLARGEPEQVTLEKHELTVGEKRAQLALVAADQESAPLIEKLTDRMLDAVHLPDMSAQTDKEKE